MQKLYIGLMSGTSLDGLDAVLVDFAKTTPQLLGQLSLSMPDDLRNKLLATCNASDINYSDFAYLDVEIARLSVSAIQELLAQTKINALDITAVGSHGQTIYHNPLGNHPTTLQIGDPNIISELTNITTVADFRRRDIAAQGQGAPLVPAFHQSIFHSSNEHRAILNIGGIANITALSRDPKEAITGFDTGPGNVLMDYWHYRHHSSRYDKDGAWAASGSINPELLEIMLNEPYFSAQPPKSTGREKFNMDWLNQRLQQTSNIDDADIQATLCELTAISITEAIKSWAAATEKVIVCGGGAYNTQLISRINNNLDIPIESSAKHGIAPDWVEAIAFAWLAKQTIEKTASNVPSVTGATHPVILGGIFHR